MAKLTVREFFKRFPDDATCLEHIMSVRYGLRHTCGKCGTVDATFHRLSNRPAYACASCGAHVYPCAGTVFQDTRTPLTVWFYVIFLFVTTRHGVSGKEIQRQIGVTYKTAWRMGQQIRLLMGGVDEFVALKGHVEIDEHFHGGRLPRSEGKPRDNKTIIVGLKERGGPMRTEIIPDTTTATLRKVVLENVQPRSTVSTDEHHGYRLLEGADYQHGTVNHHRKEWARFDAATGVNHHVQHVESFWGLFKRSVRSTHISISQKHMSKYLDEFTFRANHREMQNAMFDLLIGAV
ncbi:MAG: IS1595 family transposase [Caulobacterales bacterium]